MGEFHEEYHLFEMQESWMPSIVGSKYPMFLSEQGVVLNCSCFLDLAHLQCKKCFLNIKQKCMYPSVRSYGNVI